jgi:mannose-6-phosphate isomerase-like protein (cupin superfamily)
VIPALVDTADIPAETLASGVTVRPVLDVAGAAGGRLARRLVSVPADGVYAGTAGPAGELWFVTSGSGRLEAGGPAGGGQAGGGQAGGGLESGGLESGGLESGGLESGGLESGGQGVPVGPEHGIALAAGAAFWLVADPAPRYSGVLTIDAVTLPVTGTTETGTGTTEARTTEARTTGAGTAGAGIPASGDGRARVADLRECAAEVTGDRRFRVLFGPGTGYPAATQFVGEIPPGRAPEHSHSYDELVLVLAGDGVIHLGPASYPLRPGCCVHLPPGQLHCLENTGAATLRILGVFQPGGSPAAKQPPPS